MGDTRQLLVEMVTQRKVLRKSRENLLKPGWESFFIRLFYFGLFFLLVSAFGLAVVLFVTPRIYATRNVIGLAEVFYSGLYTPLNALLLIMSFLSRTS